MELGWAGVSGLAVVGSFDDFGADVFSFDDSRVAAVTARRVRALLDLPDRFLEGVVESVRGKNPPGW